MMKVDVGTRFESSFADANPTWSVVRPKGSGVWVCRIVPEDPDYAGTEKLFSTGEIRAILEQAENFRLLHEHADQWWARQEIGSIVHYDNGFNQYVRGEIVLHNGEKMMKPLALVGKWHERDLPHRCSDGTIYESYHVRSIREGEPKRYGVMYERDRAVPHRGRLDPTDMLPIDLSVPDMDAEQRETALLESVRAKVFEVLRNPDVRMALKEARQVLEPS